METEVKTNEKSKKSSKGLIIVIAIIAILGLCFWGVLRIPAKQAEKKVTTILSELKNGNTETAKKYLDYESISMDLGGLGSETEKAEKYEPGERDKKFFSDLDYKVKKAQANFKNAKVEIEITNKNIGQVMTNYFKRSMQLLFKSVFSEEDYSDEELAQMMVKYLEEEFNSDSIEKVTKNITIELSKENGEWEVKTEGKAIIDAILPGFVEAMNNFGDSGISTDKDSENDTDTDSDTNTTEEGTPAVL